MNQHDQKLNILTLRLLSLCVISLCSDLIHLWSDLIYREATSSLNYLKSARYYLCHHCFSGSLNGSQKASTIWVCHTA